MSDRFIDNTFNSPKPGIVLPVGNDRKVTVESLLAFELAQKA